MPLFEIGENELVPFRTVQAGPELYEKEIEDLLWSNLDAFLETELFPVARQPNLGDGLRPDIVALDRDGRVQLIEVKRDVDRGQLAQCLEYAGWGRETNLDELAGIFHDGPEAFFATWTEFTATESPRLVQRPPQLVLIARDFDSRTDAALTYLTESNLPLTVLRVTIHEDQGGRRFIDIATDHESEIAVGSGSADSSSPAKFEIDGRRVTIRDLLDNGLLEAGAELIWRRPRVGQVHRAHVLDDGQIQLEDGRLFTAPSIAAREAAGLVAAPGWTSWTLSNGRKLAELREDLLNSVKSSGSTNGEAAQTSADQDTSSSALV